MSAITPKLSFASILIRMEPIKCFVLFRRVVSLGEDHTPIWGGIVNKLDNQKYSNIHTICQEIMHKSLKVVRPEKLTQTGIVDINIETNQFLNVMLVGGDSFAINLNEGVYESVFVDGNKLGKYNLAPEMIEMQKKFTLDSLVEAVLRPINFC